MRNEEKKKVRMNRKKYVIKDAKIKESIKVKSLKEDKNATDSYPNWFDKNNFKNFLAIIDSNTFNYRPKIGEFRYTKIKEFVNKIRNNTISEISAKKRFKYIKWNKKRRNNKTKKTHSKTERIIKFIQWFVWYNFNW